jgi:hypothetical protein
MLLVNAEPRAVFVAQTSEQVVEPQSSPARAGILSRLE